MKSWSVLKRYFKTQLRLKREEHEVETYTEIKEGSDFSGYNLWILGFAMIIACIGLNLDSISAVIGAMLISPLMGPIVGFAFGLAINDTVLKKNGIRNWLWMTLISLLASTIFFLITPFDHGTGTLFSFTKATIFDIILAFFGGMAGFIGIVKKEGAKVIAGVAVATACMPPLCTAGFGIAHLNYEFFLGGLYFYLINCLFIGLATFMLSRFLGYRNHFNNQIESKKTTQWLWILFILLMIVPGVYIAYQKYQQEYNAPTIQQSDRQRIELLEQKVKAMDSLLRVKQ